MIKDVFVITTKPIVLVSGGIISHLSTVDKAHLFMQNIYFKIKELNFKPLVNSYKRHRRYVVII